MLSAPLRDRFGLYYHLDFYPPEELAEIVCRSGRLLEADIDDEASLTIAGRSRGTPRIANRLLRRVRDFATVKGDGHIDVDVASRALDAEGVDKLGLDDLDRKMLRIIIEYYNGGPVGIEALAATLNEEVDTLVDMVEPYLLKIGLVQRTRRGRVVSPQAAKHIGINAPKGDQQNLF
jgi:Holliday junction DNA helicase RuvB